MMEVNATGIKPSADESIQFQLGPENVASGVAKIEQSDMKASESDPVFQQIASRIICSDLSNNGFEVCEVGEEEQVLEEDDSEDANSDDETEDGIEVRGDGGRGGTYDRNNCTGEQCEDADEETQEEEDGDYCEIDPGYCPDKNEGNDDGDDNGNDDENNDGDSDNEEDNSNDEGENNEQVSED
jgi:segregation and condensation protein B